MPNSIVFLAALAVPLVVLVVLRINAVMVFLGLCLGTVLVRFVGGDAGSLLSFAAPHSAGSVSKSSIDLFLLLGPAMATSVFMLFSIRGHIRTMLNVLPAAGTAALGVLLTVPLLAPGLRNAIEKQATWRQFSRAQDLIVGVSALVCLIFLWTQRRHLGEGHKHHRR
ncbi:MAG TPA: hypothetical protein VGS08_02445 [Candidatus Saccharimonadales bacterium]|nr:hypothetical protein [Candidatus Saccharimonadales bacterium]